MKQFKISQSRSKQQSKSITLSCSCSQTDAWREHTKDEGVGSTAILRDSRVVSVGKCDYKRTRNVC